MTRALCTGVGIFACLACGGVLEDEQHALDASDHAVLVEVADLQSEFPATVFDPTKETWSKVKSFGSWELEYGYESDDFAVSSLVFVEDTPDDASWVMWGFGIAPAMLESEGITFDQDDSLVSGGDEKKCGVLRTDGNPVGNLCLVRDGSIAIALVMVGGYYDTPGGLDVILGAPRAALVGYTPKPSPLP
ncbi:MAG: hypothetical protein R3F61_27085 [Myxococcota bacterium]